MLQRFCFRFVTKSRAGKPKCGRIFFCFHSVSLFLCLSLCLSCIRDVCLCTHGTDRIRSWLNSMKWRPSTVIQSQRRGICSFVCRVSSHCGIFTRSEIFRQSAAPSIFYGNANGRWRFAAFVVVGDFRFVLIDSLHFIRMPVNFLAAFHSSPSLLIRQRNELTFVRPIRLGRMRSNRKRGKKR